MREYTVPALALVLVACAAPPPPTPAAAPPARPDVFAVMAAVDRASARPLWPGFDPRGVPVALHDGERTFLFRHPAPPPGFQPVPDAEGVRVFPGRHERVRANTSEELNGVRTATVLLESAGASSPERLAALVVHEAFHVFQRERHPGWAANEGELFTYPIADADLLRLRRLETEALRRALAAADPRERACWTRVALDLRADRFAALPEGARAYERATELGEGLAEYVERRALGSDPAAGLIPADGFAAAAVRARGYATGAALALLLDQRAPGWQERLGGGGATSLDELLGAAVAPVIPAGCGFSAGEALAARERAAADVAAHRSELAALRRDVLSAEGWRLVVVARGEPLWPQGFDPLNVRRLDGTEVVHTRWLRLGNAAGSIESLGVPALTEGAGEHPLYNGVRRVTVTGLAARPLVRDSAGTLVLEAAGVGARLHGSLVTDESTRTLTVELRPAGP